MSIGIKNSMNEKKNNLIDNAMFSQNVNVFRFILFSIWAHRLSIWCGDYLIVCWHADKKSTLESRNNGLFQMEFRRIAFCVLSLLFFPVCFHPNLNEMHLHKKNGSGGRQREREGYVQFYYNFDIEITPVWMGRKAIYVSLCYIRIVYLRVCVYVCVGVIEICVTNTFP